MTRVSFEDYVAIDTNVFVHLLNPQNNADSHINRLLEHLQRRGTCLLVDDRKRISGEYNHHIVPIIRGASHISNEIYILRYWVDSAHHHTIPSKRNDSLMMAINQVVSEVSEAVDRIFVYVAFKVGKPLVTNDQRHIVLGPSREQGQLPRRIRLLRDTKKLRPTGSCIMTSKEAYDEISECRKTP